MRCELNLISWKLAISLSRIAMYFASPVASAFFFAINISCIGRSSANKLKCLSNKIINLLRAASSASDNTTKTSSIASASSGSSASSSVGSSSKFVDVSTLIKSRVNNLPWARSSPHTVISCAVTGLSHKPPIIETTPDSMRFAIAISPSRDKSSTLPISRRYILTGSSVRPVTSSSVSSWLSVKSKSDKSGLTAVSSPVSASSASSSLSTMLIPISAIIVIVSSIWSEDS